MKQSISKVGGAELIAKARNVVYQGQAMGVFPDAAPISPGQVWETDTGSVVRACRRTWFRNDTAFHKRIGSTVATLYFQRRELARRLAGHPWENDPDWVEGDEYRYNFDRDRVVKVRGQRAVAYRSMIELAATGEPVRGSQWSVDTKWGQSLTFKVTKWDPMGEPTRQTADGITAELRRLGARPGSMPGTIAVKRRRGESFQAFQARYNEIRPLCPSGTIFQPDYREPERRRQASRKAEKSLPPTRADLYLESTDHGAVISQWRDEPDAEFDARVDVALALLEEGEELTINRCAPGMPGPERPKPGELTRAQLIERATSLLPDGSNATAWTYAVSALVGHPRWPWSAPYKAPAAHTIADAIDDRGGMSWLVDLGKRLYFDGLREHALALLVERRPDDLTPWGWERVCRAQLTDGDMSDHNMRAATATADQLDRAARYLAEGVRGVDHPGGDEAQALYLSTPRPPDARWWSRHTAGPATRGPHGDDGGGV